MATATQVINKALSYVGTLEVPNGSNCQIFGRAYGMNCVAWCDIFQSEIIRQVTGGYAIQGGKFSYTVSHALRYKAMGRWGTTPRVGAHVFFDWSGGKSISGIDHIGLQRAPQRSDGLVPTVEANTRANGEQLHDGVWLVNRTPRFIVGYGYPLYAPSVTGSAIPAPAAQLSVVGDWPLPRGHWFGIDDGTNYSHSGDNFADQYAIKRIQKEVGAVVDGAYGLRTKAAVVAWQTKHKAQIADHGVDGRVGPNTWAAMVRY